MQFKICCIQTAAEARAAARAGAFAVGLVAEMPSGPGPISDKRIMEIASEMASNRSVYGNTLSVLLTSRSDADGIVDHVQETGVDAVQIVDRIGVDTRLAVRRRLGSTPVFQVVHVGGPAAVAEAVDAAQGADYLLLDSGSPDAAQRTLGGTGHTHDWSVSREIIEKSPVPVFLAGGLSPQNVAAAAAATEPFGFDICSHLREREAGYALNMEKLAVFRDAVRAI